MKEFYGYMRVSTKEQNEYRQLISLKRAGVTKKENIFLDKQSGKNFDRNNYKKMVSILNENSVLFVT